MSLSAFSSVRTYTHSYQDEHTSKTLSCTIAQSVSRDGQAYLYQMVYVNRSFTEGSASRTFFKNQDRQWFEVL